MEMPERRVDIDLTTRLEYDSNVLRRPEFAAIPEGLERDDIRITPGVAVDIQLPISRQSLFLSGSVGYDFFMNNSHLNRERFDLVGGANVTAGGSCTGQLTGSYTRQQSDLGYLFAVDQLENAEQLAGYGIRLQCGGGIGLSPGLGYRHETATNSLSQRQQNDYSTDIYEADIGYQRPSFGRLSVFGTYAETEFENRVIDGVRDGVEVYSTGLRFQREIGSRLRGTVSGGYTWVKPRLPGVAEFSGISYSADLTYTPSDRLRTTIGFSREAQLSSLLDISYSISENYRFDGQYAFGPRLSLLFGLQYATRSFELSPQFPALVPQTGDKSYQAFVGVRRQWNDRFATDLDFAQERRDSDNPLLDYRSTRVGLTVRMTL